MDNIDPLIVQNEERHNTLKSIETNSDYQLQKQDEISEGIKDLNKTAEHILVQGEQEKNQTFEIEANDQNSLALWNLLRGPRGLKGDKGDKGEKGDSGKDGINAVHDVKEVVKNLSEDSEFVAKTKGDKGEKGEDGKDGKDGLRGKDGAMGVKGDTGEQGPQGVEGKRGLKGEKGKDGKDIDDEKIKEIEAQLTFVAQRASKTVSLVELDDVNLAGLTQTNGKYNLGSGAGSSITLQTDGITNPDQTKLNLVAGTNVNLTDDGIGNVTIDATGGGTVGPGTINEIAYFNATNTITSLPVATYPSLTELSYVKGVTSAIQTQLNAKGAGTVTSVTSANGDATVATTTTTPVITIVSSPKLTTARTIGTATGDVTSAGSSFDGTANNTNALTLATVNANVGSFGSATAAGTFTVNGKGLITAAGSTTITPAVGSITGLGTGVATALAVNVGTAGAPVVNGGALGTPSSGTVTNLTGTASININGTVGATTPTTGVFTTLVANATTSLLLGTAGSAVGNIGFRNGTSGTITLAPVTGALGTVTLSLPAATDILVGKATTDVFTNKTMIATTNVVEEITTTASSATPTPTGGSLRNFFTVTALAAGATFAAPSGTPVDGNYLTIRIKDNGTARTLAFNAIYRAVGVTLPTTTVISKTMYIGCRYNSADSKWDVIAYAIEA